MECLLKCGPGKFREHSGFNMVKEPTDFRLTLMSHIEFIYCQGIDELGIQAWWNRVLKCTENILSASNKSHIITEETIQLLPIRVYNQASISFNPCLYRFVIFKETLTQHRVFAATPD